MIGLFVIAGSENPDAAHQFMGSRLLYIGGQIVSLTVLVLLILGVAIAWLRGADLALLVAAVLYVPVTIAPFLTSSRYSLPVQPFVFAFVATTLVAAYDVIVRRSSR